MRAPEESPPESPGFLRLRGGILGRLDDMVLIRGNNVYPSAVDAILREVPGIAEYQARVIRDGPIAAGLRLLVEPAPGAGGDGLASEVIRAFQERLFFRPEVETVGPGTLPRFEMKGNRFIRD